MGIYFFEPEAIDLIPSGEVFDIGSQLFLMLVEKRLPFYAQKRFYHWIDIGRISDYWEVLQRVLRGEISFMDMPGKEVKPGVWVGLNTRLTGITLKSKGLFILILACKLMQVLKLLAHAGYHTARIFAPTLKWCALSCLKTRALARMGYMKYGMK